jgi:PrtD family type I secretion system ABC transporter
MTSDQTSIPQNLAKPFGGLRRPLLVVGALSLLINIAMLASPLFMLQIYDRVLVSRSLPTLVTLIVMLAGLFVWTTLLDLVRAKILGRAAAHFTIGLSKKVFGTIIGEEIAKNAQYGNQPLQDLQTLRQFATGPGLATLLDAPWLPIYLLLAFLLHPALGLLTAAAAVVLIGLALLQERISARQTMIAAGHLATSHRLFEGARRGAEVLRAMAIESAYGERWAKAFNASQQSLIVAGDRSSAFQLSTKYLRLFLQSACLGLGAALAIRGEMSAGSIIAGTIIMSRALAPVEQVTAQWGQLQNVRSAAHRLRQLLSKAVEPTKPIPLPMPKGELTVESVAIASPGARTLTVSGVSFKLAAGEAMAIVGPTGSGKSTLARSLAGVWPTVGGHIRLDGARLDTWPSRQLGAAIGYIPQDVELFCGSISENIARFTTDANPLDIIKAAQRANVHEMILRLPESYMTQIGEGGVKLSGGQRQRIALARALFGEVRIVVLDEPNSNLDDAGEAALSDTLASLRRDGVSVVVVSHRPHILKAVDKILVLREGAQVAFAPRDEILSRATPSFRTRALGPQLQSVSDPIAVAGR